MESSVHEWVCRHIGETVSAANRNLESPLHCTLPSRPRRITSEPKYEMEPLEHISRINITSCRTMGHSHWKHLRISLMTRNFLYNTARRPRQEWQSHSSVNTYNRKKLWRLFDECLKSSCKSLKRTGGNWDLSVMTWTSGRIEHFYIIALHFLRRLENFLGEKIWALVAYYS